MQRLAIAVLAFLVTIVVAGVARAASSVDEAVAVLQDNPVYVAPGTEGTSPNTAAVLQEQLREGDNIVIVMLPSPANGGPESELLDLAKTIDKATGNSRIIALSVGDETIAHSSVLPAGVAADLMERAESVSMSTTETFVTFIRNVHDWQADHPKAEASRPVEQPDEGINALPLLGGSLLGLAVLGFGLSWVINRRNEYGSPEHVAMKSSPGNVRHVMEQVLSLRDQIRNPRLKEVLTEACRDTEAYFKRHPVADLKADGQAFERHLRSVVEVLKRYVDIQDNGRYYDDPVALMSRGFRAVEGYAHFVLESVRRGNRQPLTNYNVDTDILSAQRFA